MGQYSRPDDDIVSMMRGIIHYEKLKESTGYYHFTYEKFLEIVMYEETIVYTKDAAEFLWQYLRTIGILTDFAGETYIDMDRFYTYCRHHGIYRHKENAKKDETETSGKEEVPETETPEEAQEFEIPGDAPPAPDEKPAEEISDPEDEHGLDFFINSRRTPRRYVPPEEIIYKIVESGGRVGMSYMRIIRRAREAGIDLWDAYDAIPKLFSSGRITRVDDYFIRASVFNVTEPYVR